MEIRKIDSYKGVGPKKKALFHKMGINTGIDLIYHFPKEYRDMRRPVNIGDINPYIEKPVLIKAKVISCSGGVRAGRRKTIKALVSDKTSKITLIFFNASYLQNILRKNSEHYFFGRVKMSYGELEMIQPQIISSKDFRGEIVPVYAAPKGIGQKDIENINRETLQEGIEEALPDVLVSSNNFLGLNEALYNMHFPKDRESFMESKRRLIYQDLFFLELAFSEMKSEALDGILIDQSPKEFIDKLDFDLTDSQKKSLNEILSDMSSGKRMNRLLQGDVGSGKTVVAAAALFTVASSGLQGAMIAPTEILAKQHYKTLKPIFDSFDIEIELLVGSMPVKEKKRVLNEIKSGAAKIVLGTHAVVQDSVIFKNLALVITDEQHRFGVNQRLKLSQKGEMPHILVMTATPIPRTLGIIFYGDLDMSIIDKLPEGRKAIISKVITTNERRKLYNSLLDEVNKGRQGYIVAPLISETESMEDVKSVEVLKEEIDNLYKGKEITTAILHGAMTSEEKDAVMDSFIKGDIDIIIGTVVIEVGINVPNATFMVVENAERFGLAQLHQLRGRIGRGSEQSYCYFVSDTKGEISKKRLEIMTKSTDGFYIAEKDLEMRGPGEIFGLRQHGSLDEKLKLAIRHIDILQKVKEDIKNYSKDIEKFDFSVSKSYIDTFSTFNL